jgi:hypothetical protein
MNETKYSTKSEGQPVSLFKSLFRPLVHVLLSLFRPRLYIVDDLPDFLAMDSNGYTVVASKPERIVSINGLPIATFESVEAIHIRHFVSGAGNRRREWWAVDLKILRRSAVCLGKSQDSMEASIAAAHLSKMIERPVVAI